MNQTLYIQIFAEQKHTKPDPNFAKMSTKEYFKTLNPSQKSPMMDMGLFNKV